MLDANVTEMIRLVGSCNFLLFFGNIFFNKGADRLVQIWKENQNRIGNNLLIIAGRIREEYAEYTELVKEVIREAKIP